MGIKRYIFFSIIYLVLLGVVVYSFTGSSYTINVFSHSLEFPVVIWFLIPVAALFLATLLHMMIYAIKHFFEKRVVKKDYDSLLDEIKNILLNEEKDVEYKTPMFQNISQIIKKMTFNANSDDEKIEYSNLDEVFSMLHRVYGGEYVDIKKLRLRGDNPIVLQNKKNVINSDTKVINEALKQCSDLENETCKNIFKKFISLSSSYNDIKKYNFKLNSECALAIIEKFSNNEDFNITKENINQILETVDFTKDEYIKTAKLLKTKIEPDSILAMYKSLESKKSESVEAYLYILFELQMIDEARMFLTNSDEKEYEKFKLLLFLRDNGKNIDKDLII